MALKLAGNLTLIIVDGCITNTLRSELSTSTQVLQFTYDRQNIGTHPAVAALGKFLGGVQYLKLKTSTELTATSAEMSESEPEATINQSLEEEALQRSRSRDCGGIPGDAMQDAHLPRDLQLDNSWPAGCFPSVQDSMGKPTRALPQGATAVIVKRRRLQGKQPAPFGYA